MNGLVEFVEYEPRTSYLPRDDRFKYGPSKGMAWLQRLCVWFLKRRGCYAYDETVSFTRHVIDTQKLVERVAKQNRSLIEYFHRRGERVLIGAETMAELMCEPMIHQFVTFTASYGSDGQIFGMPITVVPMMRGLIVLPRL
jgi:hypothetical protein